MKATFIEKSVVYIQCPNCLDDGSHLVSALDPGTSFGPWYCDNCGVGIRGYLDGSGSVEITEAEDRKEPTYVLLRIRPQDAPIFLVVCGADFIAQDKTATEEETEEEEFFGSDEFFYNHSCCPSITLQNTIMIIINGEANPPGIFEHVVTKSVSQSADNVGKEYSEVIFQELLELTSQTSNDK